MLLLVQGLRADDAEVPQTGRAVRLSSVDGKVRILQGNQVLADPALANTPLFEGTRIETADDGRAEIQFENGTVARVSPDSALTLSVLRGGAGGERDAEMQLNGGLAYFEIQGDSDSNHVRVRFGDNEVTASGFTVLRINLDKSPGELAVFSGNAHVEGGAAPALDLHGGQSLALNANDPSNYSVADSIEPDSWDAWNSDRDQALTTAAAGRTSATDNLPDSKNPAWDDLDANGNWYNVPDQGYVWSPYEASSPDWDPYGTGYWMNNPGYGGYAWISGEPWGYMPYQCGAWNYYNSFGWGWAPGTCQPWWGGGGGWALNIGYAPPRYRLPIRPRRPSDPRPMHGMRPVGAEPVISVHRHPPAGSTTAGITMLPSRDRNSFVTIAGTVVQPMRPVQTVRLPYNNHSVQGGPSRGFTGGASPQPGLSPGNNSIDRPRNTITPSPGYVAAPRLTAPTYARPSAPPPPPRSAPPASHPSSGGGGGHPAAGPHR
ncbi:MAG TPA: DUF6600 domain-containing protein [Terracidiphilus sp.]|jgi:hypothetical protein